MAHLKFLTPAINPCLFSIKNKTSILAVLQIGVQNLNEVVINKGYYTEKQKLSVSNVATVTAKDIEKHQCKILY
jgi:hypothetical protein